MNAVAEDAAQQNPLHSSRIRLDQANSRESDDINLTVLLGREDYCNSARLRLHLKHTGPTPGWNKGSVSVRSFGAQLQTLA